MTFTYEYPRAALTVDCVVFGADEAELKVMLIQRGLEPFAGKWALPGGFVRLDETLEEAARRELSEETGLDRVYLEQFGTFDQIDRDPRERVISVAWYALVRMSNHRIRAATDASNAAWFGIHDLPTLAFDHQTIVDNALSRLQTRVRYQPIGFELLPAKFTLTELQSLYETILDRQLDKRNFRRKILAMDLLIELDEVQSDVAHRAARLYQFQKGRYQHLLRQGFHFEV